MSIYKKEKPAFLIQSIESMLKQSVKPNEIIIVKDGPLTNELDAILSKYENNYQNLFTIIPLNKNIGLGRALNEGIRHSRNELIARMDTDDISLPHRCAVQLEEFKKNANLSIVGSNILEFQNDPTKPYSERKVPSKHEEIVVFSKKRNPFNHPSVMYKKSVILNLDGYGDFRRNQDYDLFVRLLNNGYESKNIDQSLLLFRANKDNIARRKSWQKCKSDIEMRYKFWKKGYSSLLDFIVASIGFLVSYVAPKWLFEKLSSKFLRSKAN